MTDKAEADRILNGMRATIAASETDYKNETASFLEGFANYLTEIFGEKYHGEFDPDCPCCQLWRLYDQVAKIVDFE